MNDSTDIHITKHTHTHIQYTIYNIDIYPQHIYANIYNATREFYVSSRTEHNINNNNIQCIYILCVCV